MVLARGVVVKTATKISNLVRKIRFWNKRYDEYQKIGKPNNSKFQSGWEQKKKKRKEDSKIRLRAHMPEGGKP